MGAIAELLYVENVPDAGRSNVVISHYQAELITDTLDAVEMFYRRKHASTYFLDVFSIRQSVADFQVKRIEKLINDIGHTIMAELLHVENDPGAGLSNVFNSHEVVKEMVSDIAYSGVVAQHSMRSCREWHC